MGANDHNICRRRVAVPGFRGLHGREAAMLVKLARAFDAELMLECHGRTTNARSIMELLSLGSENCAEWTATAEGPEAEKLIRAVEAVFAAGVVAEKE